MDGDLIKKSKTTNVLPGLFVPLFLSQWTAWLPVACPILYLLVFKNIGHYHHFLALPTNCLHAHLLYVPWLCHMKAKNCPFGTVYLYGCFHPHLELNKNIWKWQALAGTWWYCWSHYIACFRSRPLANSGWSIWAKVPITACRLLVPTELPREIGAWWRWLGWVGGGGLTELHTQTICHRSTG